MADFSGRNTALKDNFEDASSRLDTAWAVGGSSNSDAMVAFAEWFDAIYMEFYLLWEEGELSDAAGSAALAAVEDMLEITGPSHAAYKAQMVSIRECITPGMTYDDYPPSDVEDDEEDDNMSTESD